MSERFANDLERELASCLEPVHAPRSLWDRVEAEISAPRQARGHSLPRLALVFGLLLVSAVSVGWYFERPAATRATPGTRSQHACIVCHG